MAIRQWGGAIALLAASYEVITMKVVSSWFER